MDSAWDLFLNGRPPKHAGGRRGTARVRALNPRGLSWSFAQEETDGRVQDASAPRATAVGGVADLLERRSGPPFAAQVFLPVRRLGQPSDRWGQVDPHQPTDWYVWGLFSRSSCARLEAAGPA